MEAGHSRALTTTFGEVAVTRLAYRRRHQPNLHPADGALNLSVERHSHGIRGLAAVEAVRGSQHPEPRVDFVERPRVDRDPWMGLLVGRKSTTSSNRALECPPECPLRRHFATQVGGAAAALENSARISRSLQQTASRANSSQHQKARLTWGFAPNPRSPHWPSIGPFPGLRPGGCRITGLGL